MTDSVVAGSRSRDLLIASSTPLARDKPLVLANITASYVVDAEVVWLLLGAAAEAPIVVKGLEDCEVIKQGTAKFSAKITGVPRPTVTW